MKIDEFIKEVTKLQISIDNIKLELLEKYYQLIKEYNEHTNITNIVEKDEVYLKHFYDSLTVVKAVNLEKIDTLLDIGSGAGFPGIVLKIFYPNLKITLLDSNNKKTKFMEYAIESLNLSNIKVINMRAEDYALNNLNEYDIVTSRAVAFVDIITSLSIPFVKKSGKVILMKGNILNEEKILEKYSKNLNIKNYEIINFKLPVIKDERNLVVITKELETKKVMTYSQILKRNKLWNK